MEKILTGLAKMFQKNSFQPADQNYQWTQKLLMYSFQLSYHLLYFQKT